VADLRFNEGNNIPGGVCQTGGRRRDSFATNCHTKPNKTPQAAAEEQQFNNDSMFNYLRIGACKLSSRSEQITDQLKITESRAQFSAFFHQF
jgi:hypothetical protein